MAADTFRFFASHVQVELRCEHGPTLAAMRAVWGGCVRPLLATTQRVELEVTPEGDGYAIPLADHLEPLDGFANLA